MMPQIILLVLIFLQIVVGMKFHGELAKIDFRYTFVRVCLFQGILIWGGFYNNLFM
jgi:hypothetical protein